MWVVTGDPLASRRPWVSYLRDEATKATDDHNAADGPVTVEGTAGADCPIPGFQSLMLPTLGALEGRAMLSARKRMEFANRIGRCLTHLRYAGLVERVQEASIG